MKCCAFLCLAALSAPLLFAQVQISGPTVVIGGAGSVGGTTGQAQINNGGVLGAVPVMMDNSGNIATPGTIAATAAVANATNTILNAAQWASGTQDGGIAEAYASSDCMASGCEVDAGGDITITTPQTWTKNGSQNFIINLQNHKLTLNCASGNCLSINVSDTTSLTPFTIENGTITTTNATSAFTGLYISNANNITFHNITFKGFGYAGGTNPTGSAGQIALNGNNWQDSALRDVTFTGNNISEQLDNFSDNVQHFNVQYRYGCPNASTGSALIINSGNADRFTAGTKLESNLCQNTVVLSDSGNTNNTILDDFHMEQNGGSLTSPCYVYITAASGITMTGLSFRNGQITGGPSGAGQNATFMCYATGTGGHYKPYIWDNLGINGFGGSGYTGSGLTSGMGAGWEPIETNVFAVGPVAFTGNNYYQVAINTRANATTGVIPGLSFFPFGTTAPFSLNVGTGIHAAGEFNIYDYSSGSQVAAGSYDPLKGGWYFPSWYQYGGTCNGSLTLPLASAYLINVTGNCTLTLPTGLDMSLNPDITLKQDATGGWTVGYTNLNTFAGAIPPVNTAANSLTSYHLVWLPGGPYWVVGNTPVIGSSTQKGALQCGTNTSCTGGSISVPQGSSSQPGVLQCGSGTTCSGGVVSVPSSSSGSINWFVNGNIAAAPGAGKAFVQNKTVYFDFNIPNSITVSAISYYVQTADNTANVYDVGIYDLAGANLLLAKGGVAGTTFASATGMRSLAFASSATLSPGTYIIALTTNCASACAVLGSNNLTMSYARFDNASNTTTGGVLNSTLTVVSPTYTNVGSQSEWAFILHN